jgi:hypothetical protein
MKILLSLIGMMLLGAGCKTAAVAQNNDKAYAIGVSFNSICCGPPSDEFLKTLVKNFNRSEKVKITAGKIAGCGREGEYVILFNTEKLKASTRTRFIAELEKQVPLQEIRNKAANSSSGGVQVIKDVKNADFSHCRISLQNWAFEK